MAVAPYPLPPVVCVCGYKRSGKTLLVTRLVRHLSDLGLAIGTIKHDGHSFSLDLDQQGTDSWRHRVAGARASAVFSPECWALFRDGMPDPADLLGLMADMDLVLVEGLKDSAWPKIVLCGDSGEYPAVSGPLLAVISRFRKITDLSCPCLHPDEIGAIAALVCGLRTRKAADVSLTPSENEEKASS